MEHKYSLQVATRRKDLSEVVLKATIIVESDLEEEEVGKVLTMMEMQANGNTIDPELFGMHTTRVWVFKKSP